jgi:hypothetical protein
MNEHYTLLKKDWAAFSKTQPNTLTNSSPCCSITSWTGRKCVRVIIQSDYFTTFCALIKSLSGFFACTVHNLKFKKLITHFSHCHRLIKTSTSLETLLSLFFDRTNFNSFSYCCGWSPCCLPVRNKLSGTGVSNSGRCFTHNLKFKN